MPPIQMQYLEQQIKNLPKNHDELIHRAKVLKFAFLKLESDHGILKTCNCCQRTFTLQEWDQLKYIGWQEFPFCQGEMRSCVCTSTLLLVVQKTKNF